MPAREQRMLQFPLYCQGSLTSGGEPIEDRFHYGTSDRLSIISPQPTGGVHHVLQQRR